MNKQIITIPLQDGNQTYTPQFALFEMIDGRAVMTPCDVDGNALAQSIEEQEQGS